MSNSPCIIVLTAPSGSGKTTLARRLLEAEPSIRFSVSATTREPRAGEQDGVHYHFLTPGAFREAIAANELLEHEEVYPDRFYGTLRREVEASASHAPVLLDIDVQGAEHVKRLFPDRALTVFIRPPSIGELERRLRSRGTESEEALAVRLERVRYELTFESRFDSVVVNDDLETATAALISQVRAFLSHCAETS